MWGCLTLVFTWLLVMGGMANGLEGVGVNTDGFALSVLIFVISGFISVFILKMILILFGLASEQDIKNNRLF